LLDVTNNRLQIAKNLHRGNPTDARALASQPCIADFIPRRPIAAPVRLPVDLDHQAVTRAKEIKDVVASGVLVAKSQTGRTFAQRLPEKHFGQRHFAPKLSGALLRVFRAVQHVARYPSTKLHLVPLPLRGRICFS